MQDDLLRDIEEIIQSNSELIPAGYKYWNTQTTSNRKSSESLLRILMRLFEKEEIAIEKVRNKPYVTDSYENGVRRFAAVLMDRLTKAYKDLDGLTSYINLLGQKHMAYAFYSVLDKQNLELYHMILKDTQYTKSLYHGLTKFYNTFYGNFKDNEEAICLLCKYYPKEYDAWLKQEDVINALFDHIKNAGTPNDFGYAYHGIEQIQKYIHGLPDKLILELLKQYRLYDVLNQEIYRHQMFAIINGSEMEEKDKQYLKFFYLDSLLLANAFNNVWTEKEKESDNGIEVYYNHYNEKLGKGQIQVLKNPNAYWDNKTSEKRLFWVDRDCIAEIFMYKMTITFSFKFKKVNFPFEYSDWSLQDFGTRKIPQKIYQLVLGDDVKPEKRQMIFSLLYLDAYRGIKPRMLDFDHRFTFCPESKEVKRRKTKQNQGIHFYGESVYSLTCIVGKNGTGKTSIVDFLRDIFYKILKIIEDFSISCENGFVDTDNIDMREILGGEAKFLVVFRIGKQDYF